MSIVLGAVTLHVVMSLNGSIVIGISADCPFVTIVLPSHNQSS
ncbi:MAG: hypothetical protein ACR5K5_00005 [Wolbachia sp.]